MMPLFKVEMPANAGIFFAHMMQIAAFDFYDFSDHIHELFQIEPTDPLSPNFEAIGFESQYFLVNMGSMVLFYLFFFLLVLLSLILMLCCSSKRCKRVGKFRASLKRKIYWGQLITLMNESYSILFICVLINAKVLSYDTKGLAVMSVLCAIFLSLSILVPFIFTVHLCRNSKELHKKKWFESYGAFYQGLDTRVGKKFLAVPVFFLIRRAMLAVAVCVVNKTLIYQVYIMWGQIVFQTFIIGSGVYSTKGARRSEFFNEITLMLVLYTVLCFSPWLDDIAMRIIIGYIVCSIVIIHFLVNFFIILRGTYDVILTKCLKKGA